MEKNILSKNGQREKNSQINVSDSKNHENVKKMRRELYIDLAFPRSYYDRQFDGALNALTGAQVATAGGVLMTLATPPAIPAGVATLATGVATAVGGIDTATLDNPVRYYRKDRYSEFNNTISEKLSKSSGKDNVDKNASAVKDTKNNLSKNERGLTMQM